MFAYKQDCRSKNQAESKVLTIEASLGKYLIAIADIEVVIAVAAVLCSSNSRSSPYFVLFLEREES